MFRSSTTTAVLLLAAHLACVNTTLARPGPPPPSPIDGMSPYEVRRLAGDACGLAITERILLDSPGRIIALPEGRDAAIVIDQSRLYTFRAGAPVTRTDLSPLPEPAVFLGIAGVITRPDGPAAIRSLSARKRYHPPTSQYDLIDLTTGKVIAGPADPQLSDSLNAVLVRGRDATALLVYTPKLPGAMDTDRQPWVAFNTDLKELGRWQPPQGWNLIIGALDVNNDGWNDVIVATLPQQWGSQPWELTALDVRSGRSLAHTTLPKGIAPGNTRPGAGRIDPASGRLLFTIYGSHHKRHLMALQRTEAGDITAELTPDSAERFLFDQQTNWQLPGGNRMLVKASDALPFIIPGAREPSPQHPPQFRLTVEAPGHPDQHTEFAVQLGRETPGAQVEMTAIPGDPGAFIVVEGRELLVLRLTPAR